jgi:hypothetical protein
MSAAPTAMPLIKRDDVLIDEPGRDAVNSNRRELEGRVRR